MGVYRGKVLYGFVFPQILASMVGLNDVSYLTKIHTIDSGFATFFGVMVDLFTVDKDIPQIPDASLEDAHETLIREIEKIGNAALDVTINNIDMTVMIVHDGSQDVISY